MNNIVRNKLWQEGKMSNAKLYSLYTILSSGYDKFSRADIECHSKKYSESTHKAKAKKLEVACRFLKSRLTNNERKYLQIEKRQWKKWRGMCCWFTKTIV